MKMKVTVNGNVTKEEADDIVALFKQYLADPSFRAFADFEQKWFFEEEKGGGIWAFIVIGIIVFLILRNC